MWKVYTVKRVMAMGLFLLILLAVGPSSGLSADEADTPPTSQVVVATFEGVINPVAAEYLAKAIQKAEQLMAEALVVQLDTPGGLDTSMRLIIKAINASNVPVIIYVSPSGARAASAGTFMLLSAHLAAMAPGTNVGAAHPVAMGGGKMDKTMKEKVENDAAAYIKSLAEKRGRNVQWAEDAVRKSVSVTEQEALALPIIDVVAPSITALLEAVDGREVLTTGTEPRILHTKGARVIHYEMGTRLRILLALSDPNIAFVLMSLGMAGLFFELSNPGLILPGVVGAISLILAFYSFQTLPISYAGLALIVLGIILFIAEIKVTSYGLLTVGGVIAMLLGSLMLIDTEVPFMSISWSVVVPTVFAMTLFFAVSISLVLRSHGRKSVSGVEGMIGEEGRAKTDLAPDGQVFLHGELWDARSEEPIQQGEPVEVVSVRGLKLLVKRHV